MDQDVRWTDSDEATRAHLQRCWYAFNAPIRRYRRMFAGLALFGWALYALGADVSLPGSFTLLASAFILLTVYLQFGLDNALRDDLRAFRAGGVAVRIGESTLHMSEHL